MLAIKASERGKFMKNATDKIIIHNNLYKQTGMSWGKVGKRKMFATVA